MVETRKTWKTGTTVGIQDRSSSIAKESGKFDCDNKIINGECFKLWDQYVYGNEKV